MQVNAQGVARVLVRAEHSEGFSDDEELQIGAVLDMLVPAQSFTVAQAIMAAPTPTDSRAKAAYQVINAQYRRADSIALRSFADTYHARTPDWSLQPLKPSFTTRWRDHRATVLAFAKPDADPTTADGSRAWP